MELVLIILVAFSVAVLFSMLGLGGAVIYTPLFFWLGIPLLAAIPMALLLNTITTASASLTYLRQHLVDREIAAPLIVTSVLGAIAGSYLAGTFDRDLLILLLSMVLLFVSLRILFFSRIGLSVGANAKHKRALVMAPGFFIGIVSSLVGVGGGAFMVPLLLILGSETKNATATSAFIITFMAFTGFLAHVGFGHEQLDMTLLFFAGTAAFIGAQTGSRVIFNRVSSASISRMFGVVLLLVVSKLLYGLLV